MKKVGETVGLKNVQFNLGDTCEETVYYLIIFVLLMLDSRSTTVECEWPCVLGNLDDF